MRAIAAQTVAINLLALTGPLYMLALLGGLAHEHLHVGALVATLFMFGLYGLSAVVDIARQGNVTWCAMRLERGAARLASGRMTRRAPQDVLAIGTWARSQVPAALCDLPLVPLYLIVLWLFHPVLGVLAAVSAAAIVGCIVLIERYTGRDGSAQRRRVQYDAALQRAALSACTLRALRPALQSTMLGVGVYLAATEATHPASIFAAAIILPRLLAPVEIVTTHRRIMSQAHTLAVRLATADMTTRNARQARAENPHCEVRVVLRKSRYARSATGAGEISTSSDLRPTAQ